MSLATVTMYRTYKSYTSINKMLYCTIAMDIPPVIIAREGPESTWVPVKYGILIS